MLHLYENGVEILRKKISNRNVETYWENYNFVIWKKDKGGYSNTKGVFRKNDWGIVDITPVSNKGTWVFPPKYVKYFK